MRITLIIILLATNLFTLFHYRHRSDTEQNKKIDRLLDIQDSASKEIGRLNYKYSVYIWAQRNHVKIDFKKIDDYYYK